MSRERISLIVCLGNAVAGFFFLCFDADSGHGLCLFIWSFAWFLIWRTESRAE